MTGPTASFPEKCFPRRGIRSRVWRFAKRTPRGAAGTTDFAKRTPPRGLDQPFLQNELPGGGLDQVFLQNELPRGGWTRRFAKRTPLGLRHAGAAQRLTKRTQSSFARAQAETRRVRGWFRYLIFKDLRPEPYKGRPQIATDLRLSRENNSNIGQGCAGVAQWRLALRKSDWTTSRLDSITWRGRNRPAKTNRRWWSDRLTYYRSMR